MHGRPATHSLGDTHTSHPNRWRILGVLVLALLVTSIDHTIINVAMPQLVGDLSASSASLQWIVASYTIVFAGLLLTAGSIGAPITPRSTLARRLGCELDADGYIITTGTGATSHPLVWAAGDVRRPVPMPHQVVLAAADGSTAAIDIHKAFVVGSLGTRLAS